MLSSRTVKIALGLFLTGVAVRILLMTFSTPRAPSSWFIPFVTKVGLDRWSNPWQSWIDAGGVIEAFPYGYAMWAALSPLSIVETLYGSVGWYSYALILFAFDVGILIVLLLMLPRQLNLVLLTYWLSPVVIVATYVFGFNDVVPALFLVSSLLLLKRGQGVFSGVLLALAVSAKLSMVIALPFMLMYLLRNQRDRHLFSPFVISFVVAAMIVIVPALLLEGFRTMLSGTPELGKVAEFRFAISSGVWIFVTPIVYGLLLYGTWRIGRMNFRLLTSVLSLSILIVVVLAPSPLGWFVWLMPLLVLYESSSDRTSKVLVTLLGLLAVLSAFLADPIDTLASERGTTLFGIELPIASSSTAVSVSHTLLLVLGIVLGIRMWREEVLRNQLFQVSRKPIAIGIAGDSGVGKDTYADALTLLFGPSAVAKVSGDDYHLWDRSKTVWNSVTHLNPMSNDLAAFSRDTLTLLNGRSIWFRRYDHETGVRGRSQESKPRNIVLVSGLHALYLPELRSIYSLAVFLGMDEALRTHFKLMRDTGYRGRSTMAVLEQIQKRQMDANQYISIQRETADLVFWLSLIQANPDKTFGGQLNRLMLECESPRSTSDSRLTQVLVGLCGVSVHSEFVGNSKTRLRISTEVTAADIEAAAWAVCPEVLEILQRNPVWLEGSLGLMQLISMTKFQDLVLRGSLR